MSKLTETQLEYLQIALREIDFGLVEITVDNGEITQIGVTETKRFDIDKLGYHQARIKVVNHVQNE